MKTNKIIIAIIIGFVLTSCFSEKYRIITRVHRDGSCWREIQTIADSMAFLFPYDLSSGWEISQTDTVVDEYLSPKNKKIIMVGKKFNSVDELSEGLHSDKIFPVAKESLKKRFRWFYTYYAFTAVYPEITDKGQVPLENYLNKAEQKFYLQGDMSAYRGMAGWELKEALNDIDDRFMEWYNRSMYGESLDIIMHYAGADFHSKLSAVKDTLYSINKKQMSEPTGVKEVCLILDKYLVTDRFSNLYAENEQAMDSLLEERTKVTDELLNFDLQYELTLPGKIIATNTPLQNEGTLVWGIHLFRFLADDYTLTAESRTVNGWAFAITLLLIVFAVYCFCKSNK